MTRKQCKKLRVDEYAYLPVGGDLVQVVSIHERDIRARYVNMTGTLWLDPQGWVDSAEDYPGVSAEGASWAMETQA